MANAELVDIQGVVPGVTLPVGDAVLDATVAGDGDAYAGDVQLTGGWVYQSGGNKTVRGHESDAGNGMVVCDSAHHEQHEGFSFKAFFKNLSLGNGANMDVVLRTGAAGGRPHLTVAIESSSSCEWLLYEDATINVAGTPVTIRNAYRDMQAVHVTTATVEHTPTVGAVGTQIDGGTLGGGTGSGRVGASQATRSEWIVKTNAIYLIRVTNDANTNRVYIKLDYYSNHDASGNHVL